jgi:hypothetical protein
MFLSGLNLKLWIHLVSLFFLERVSLQPVKLPLNCSIPRISWADKIPIVNTIISRVYVFDKLKYGNLCKEIGNPLQIHKTETLATEMFVCMCF